MYSAIRRQARMALVLAALGGAACSSSDDSGGGGGDNSCSFKLTGAVTANIACTTTTASAAYLNSSNQTVVGFATVTTGATSAVAAVEFTGQPTNSTHSSSDQDAVGGVTVTSGGVDYIASPAPTAYGSYSMHITSVSEIGSTAQGIAYTIHGTLTATLPANGTGSAVVTLTATF